MYLLSEEVNSNIKLPNIHLHGLNKTTECTFQIPHGVTKFAFVQTEQGALKCCVARTGYMLPCGFS